MHNMHAHPNENGGNGPPSPLKATLHTVGERDAGQRLDNFLIRICKGVPKSHLYRIVRSGEIRVNKGRVDVQYRLVLGDLVRIPPLRIAEAHEIPPTDAPSLDLPVLYEDEGLLIVNKPSGIAVHGGSGISHGVVERLRVGLTGKNDMLELAHRLDRETSGVLVLAKKRSYLSALQEQIRSRSWSKHYQCLTLGEWPESLKQVDLSLMKTDGPNGEKKVYVHPEGQVSLTKFRRLALFQHPELGAVSLMQAHLITGRTHQIRVHTSAKGHPILGDDRYGQFAINRIWSKFGLSRMFLHAMRLELNHPKTGERIVIEAPLPDMLACIVKKLIPYAI